MAVDAEPCPPGFWEKALKNHESAASVQVFPHAPLNNFWNVLSFTGTVAELMNDQFPDDVINPNSFWYVEIVKTAGYYAQIRCLGYPEEQADEVEQRKFWIHYKHLQEVNTYAREKVPGIAPWPIKFVAESEVESRLFKSMVGKFSINFLRDDWIERSYKTPWKVGDRVETVDKDCISQMRAGYIGKILGRRVNVFYWNSVGKKENYWAHADSDHIKHPGWSKAVGANISAPKNYMCPELSEEDVGVKAPDIPIEVGMQFEMLNPIRTNEIAVAQVTEVLKYGYFKSEIISRVVERDLTAYCNGKNEFIFHVNSPHIFPRGSCKRYGCDNEIPLSKTLARSLSKTLPIPAKQLVLPPKFEPGMYVEVVDAHVTKLICPAKVVRVLGPYAVRIRFLGWSFDYDQWKPMDSHDLFPIGWCDLVEHQMAAVGDKNDEESDPDEFPEDELTPDRDIPSTAAELSPKDDDASKSAIKNRRKSLPKKLVLIKEIRVEHTPPPLPPPKLKKAPGRKKSVRAESSDDSEIDNRRASTSSSSSAKRGRKSTTPLKDRGVPKINEVRVKNEDTSGNSRRSSRSRAAPEFFGENVTRRNSRNAYME